MPLQSLIFQERYLCPLLPSHIRYCNTVNMMNVKQLTAKQCAHGSLAGRVKCIFALPPSSSVQRTMITRATNQEETSTSTSSPDLGKELNKFTRQTASTFAPRSSTATKNPAVKGSVLYNVFEVQGWLSLVVGGLLSFNVLFPSDEPDIARLLGMWSIWMLTIPALRAKECTPREKDALNVLFVGMPLLNILLPFIWKSFAFIFASDTLMVLGVYWWKGVWQEVYGIPFAMAGALDTPLPGSAPQQPTETQEQQQQ